MLSTYVAHTLCMCVLAVEWRSNGVVCSKTSNGVTCMQWLMLSRNLYNIQARE